MSDSLTLLQGTATADDWKDEYLPRLQKSFIYATLVSRCSDTDSEIVTLVHDAVSYSVQRTKTIIKHMGEFTLHDGDHLFRVLNIMERLLTKEAVKLLSVPELMLLILTAFFHDIGMAPTEREVLTWKKIWDLVPELEDEDQESFNKFKRFYSARPEQQEIIEKLIEQKQISKAETIKAYLITEFIRQTHAERAREIIGKDWDNKILFRDTDLTLELANICNSHNEDALKLLDFDDNYLCGAGIHACLPLIGIILRLSDILDFDGKRTPAILYSHLYVRHPVSIKEWNKHRAIENWEINSDLIQFSAKCTHPAIEASIHEFCDMIDRELSVCSNVASELNEFNQRRTRSIPLKFPFKVNRDKIKTEKDIRTNQPKYTYKDTKFNLSKRQVIDLLMGTKLYANPEVALRELLQNSIDACLLRQAQEIKWKNLYEPEITVKYYSEKNEEILEVTDNGTGMDEYIIDNYYSKVGSSFYNSTDFYDLQSESNAEFTPMSRFGIGILSCFMVADTLIVDTRRVLGRHDSSPSLNITVEGQESIFWIRPGQKDAPGTTTKLILRKVNPWEKMSEDEFIKSVETVVPNPPFKINIETSKQKKIRDQNSFKEVSAISLKDYSWKENENIRTFEIPIDKKEIGIIGSAIVAILESHGKPVERINLNSRDVEVEGVSYSLTKNLKLAENKITQESKSITISDDGEIKEDSSTQQFASSTSRLSLHGIEVPTTLFPDFWRVKNNQVKISWPFPLIIVVDVCGKRDLDLNSSRTEIIKSEKWTNFEEELAFIICSGIAKEAGADYWNELKKILASSSMNEQFLRSISSVTI
jgi:molecular chaperone HtpG